MQTGGSVLHIALLICTCVYYALIGDTGLRGSLGEPGLPGIKGEQGG